MEKEESRVINILEAAKFFAFYCSYCEKYHPLCHLHHFHEFEENKRVAHCGKSSPSHEGGSYYLDSRPKKELEDIEELLNGLINKMDTKSDWDAGAKAMLDRLIEMGYIELDCIDLVKKETGDIYES